MLFSIGLSLVTVRHVDPFPSSSTIWSIPFVLIFVVFRKFHNNCFIEILSPYLKNEQANQFELQYNTNKIFTEVICSMASPKIYLVPDLLLQIVQFGSKLALPSTPESESQGTTKYETYICPSFLASHATEFLHPQPKNLAFQTLFLLLRASSLKPLWPRFDPSADIGSPTNLLALEPLSVESQDVVVQTPTEQPQDSLLRIDLDVQAPSVLIPANSQSKEGIILVIDLGRITVKHDGTQPGMLSKPRGSHRTPLPRLQSPELFGFWCPAIWTSCFLVHPPLLTQFQGANLEIAELPESVKGSRQFDIKMDSLSVTLVDAEQHQDAQDAQERRKIIKKFEINLQIFLKNSDQKNFDVYVFGGLPSLKFYCSPDLVDETLFIMLQVANFAKRASVALSGDKY